MANQRVNLTSVAKSNGYGHDINFVSLNLLAITFIQIALENRKYYSKMLLILHLYVMDHLNNIYRKPQTAKVLIEKSCEVYFRES